MTSRPAQADGNWSSTEAVGPTLIVVKWFLFAVSAWLFVQSYDVPVPLFATWTGMVIHMLATLPLGLVVAEYLSLSRLRAAFRYCAAIIASLLYWIAAVWLSAVAQAVPLEYWLLGLARVVLCVTYHCIWVSCYPALYADSSISNKKSFALIALVVLVLPASFGLGEMRRFADATLSAVHSNRLAEAHRSALRLIQLDSSRKLDGANATIVAGDLRERILATEQLLTTTHSPPLQPSQAVMYLLSLARLDEAESLLAQLPQDSPEVQILGILIARERRDWGQVRQRCIEYLKHPSNGMQATVLNSLAEAHGNLGEIPQAISVYQQMISTSTSPSDLANAHFRLGLIHLEQGDSVESRSQLNQAIALDPSLQSEAVKRFHRLQNFSCQLRATSTWNSHK